MYSFPDLEPVCCSMSGSNCCLLTCIQIFQEASKMIWYSHLLKNFLHFVVIHTIKGFGIVNEADVFLELSCFFNDLMDVGNLISGSSGFSKSSLNIWKFLVHVLLKPSLENFEHYFACMGEVPVGGRHLGAHSYRCGLAHKQVNLWISGSHCLPCS